MPIRRYLGHGVVFSPEALSAMGKALEAAIWSLGPECDEMKREAVARFIIRLAREGGNLDATTLHRRTVAAFGSLSFAAICLAGADSKTRNASEWRSCSIQIWYSLSATCRLAWGTPLPWHTVEAQEATPRCLSLTAVCVCAA